MMDLKHIQGIIWDLDGTLYRYSEVFLHACNVAAARTAIAMGLPLAFEDAYQMAVRSEIETGSSFRFYSEYGLKYQDFHHPYHEAVDAAVIEKNKEMVEHLELLGLPMVILTNASRHWASRAIAQIDMGHLFDPSKILCLEDAGYESKSHSKRGYEKALGVLGISAESTMMVEDMAANLMHAKSMGMTTIFVHHGRNANTAPHIDALFPDTLSLMRHMRGI